MFAVFVDATPPTTFCGGMRTPPPNVPGVTLAAETLPAPPLTLPMSIPLKNGAVTPPLLTMMPDDVTMLAWLGPLAVNVPDAAVTPFVTLSELLTTPPGKVCTSGKVFAVFVDATPPTTFCGGMRTPAPNVPGVTLAAATLPAPPLTPPTTVP